MYGKFSRHRSSIRLVQSINRPNIRHVNLIAMRITNINVKRCILGGYTISGLINDVLYVTNTNDDYAFRYLNDDYNQEFQRVAISICKIQLENKFYHEL
jgi:hypothetical protein